MKIGLTRRNYSASGGAEQYLLRFAAALQAEGHEPVLFTTRDWDRRVWQYGSLITVQQDSPFGFAKELQSVYRDHCEILFSLERVWSCDVYRAGDGVHRAWLKRRTPFESYWRSAFRKLNFKHRQMLQLESSLFKNQQAGRIIANSRLVAKEIVDWYGYPSEKIEVIYNGLAQSGFQLKPKVRKPLRESIGLSESDYLVFFAGSGWERKGLQFAVEAIQAFSSGATLVVAGRGNPGAYRNSRVRFLGAIPNVQDWLNAADVFLLPTLYDPFSNATLEAFAAGLPVITSSGNGFSEVLREGETGSVIADVRDTESIVQALHHWSDCEHRKAARPVIFKAAQAFTIEANLAATLRVLSDVRDTV